MDDPCELTLILPAYNEEAGIGQAVVEADEALTRLGVTYEVVVVDDGSTDATAAVVEKVQADRPRVRLIRHLKNRGYGAALRTGFEAARGSRIAFTDADCQFYLDDLRLLLPLLEHSSIAVGFRVDRQDTRLRKFYSRGYNLLARTLLGTSVRDIDCALKVFRRDAIVTILPETNGFFVNTEMLTRARQHHLPVAEVGVRHRPRVRGASKVSIGDVPRVLRALLPFWWSEVLFPGNQSRTEACGDKMSGRLQSTLVLVLLALTAVLFLGRLDHPLLEPEEARYAEIPRQMLREGRLLVPVLHGEEYWQKPPLLYWLVMASYKVFGVHDWAARLIPALAGVICVGLTTAWGWRSLGFWTGFMSGAILLLTVRFVYLAGMLSMDGLLCMWVLLGLAAGHLAVTETRLRTIGSIVMAIACALGILTKGPVALLLVGVPLVAMGCLDARCRLWSRREGILWLTLIGVLALPWYIVMATRAPGAAGAFLWVHHAVRYFAPIDHEKPMWFYLPSVLLGAMPWTLLLAPMIPYLARRSLRAGLRRPGALGSFILAFLWCIAFFSFSGCKRQGYILPAFPLFALIVGTFVTHGLPWRAWLHATTTLADQAGQRWARRLTATACIMAISCCAAAAVTEMWGWKQAGILAIVFAGIGLLVSIPSGRRRAWMSLAGSAGVVYLFLMLAQRSFLPDYHDRFGLRRQVEISASYEQEEGLPVFTYPRRWDSVSFYSGREDVESYSEGELDQLIRDLQRHERAMVFVRRDRAFQRLMDRLPPELTFEALGRQSDFVLVGVIRKR